MHLTLRFIGEVDETVADEISLALTGVRFDSFEIALGGVGIFGKGRAARSLWAGIVEPTQVVSLHEKIDRVLDRVGIAPETRKFKPHITLARLKSPDVARVREFLGQEGDFRTDPFLIDSFHLFSSRLAHTGAQHRIEESYGPG